MEIEVWKPVFDIKYCDYYQVSSLGRVKVKRKNGTERLLKSYTENRGYLRVTLFPRIRGLNKNEGRTHYRIHRLVMLTFVGGGDGMEVNHINGDKTDNRLTNLEWCTSSENSIHAIKNGLQPIRRRVCQM